MEENKENQRRKFIKNFGLVLGLGAVTTTGALITANHVQKKKGKTTTVLTHEGELVEVDTNDLKPLSKEEYKEVLEEQQKRGKEGIPDRKWVMVIDLSKCRNARACIAACQ